MPWSELDTAAVSRALSQIAEQPEDLVDAYFERREEVELPPEEAAAPGPRLRRETGFAVRLLRGRRGWLASRDDLGERAFAEAMRQVARVLPAVGYPEPAVRAVPPGRCDVAEMLDFPGLVARAVRAHHVGFPVRLGLRRHRRWLQVVGPRLVAEPQREAFYSCTLDLPWGRHGALLPRLDAAAAAEVADAAVALFRARHATPPAAGRETVVVLGPAAVAVLLHEAVAHALEADTLARGGRPEAALGVQLGATCLDVLDDPRAAPAEVRRDSDDEGIPVCRRWLLRGGVVEQPLADAAWSRAAPALLPGAGRRGSRHLPPGPRSSHLELLPGTATESDLLSGAGAGGLYLPAATRGTLDPLTGRFTLLVPHVRRIRRGALAEPAGACALRGQVADLLGRATAAGAAAVPAGAGWCAKGGQKLPVWATVPPLRMEGVAVEAAAP